MNRSILAGAAITMLALAVAPMMASGSTSQDKGLATRVAKLERDVAVLTRRFQKEHAANVRSRGLRRTEKTTQVWLAPGQRQTVVVQCNRPAVAVGGGYLAGDGIAVFASGGPRLLKNPPGPPPGPNAQFWAIWAENKGTTMSHLDAEAICAG